MKTLNQLAQEALDVQDACNLSGVAISFANAMKDLCEHANAGGHGTDWKNTHPVAVLWSSKIASLTGSDSGIGFSRAYEECLRLAKDAS